MMTRIAVLLFLFVPFCYGQTVYRCTGPSGETVFSQMACPDNTAGAAVTVRPANTLQSAGGSAAGDPPADKYVRPLDLDDDIHSNYRRVKALADVGLIKSRNCDWDMKVTKKWDRCKDFMAFMLEGSEYNQALEYVTSLPESDLRAIEHHLPSLNRIVEQITQTKITLMAYIRSL